MGTVHGMASLDDAAQMAADLPEVTEGERRGNRTWSVGGKTFAWERPFSKADLRRSVMISRRRDKRSCRRSSAASTGSADAVAASTGSPP